jgi:hypothetical protein
LAQRQTNSPFFFERIYQEYRWLMRRRGDERLGTTESTTLATWLIDTREISPLA